MCLCTTTPLPGTYTQYNIYTTVLLCRFLDDVEVMLKWRPPSIYKYMWKYVCLLSMIGLLFASLLRMVFKRPTYTAWDHDTVIRTHVNHIAQL